MRKCNIGAELADAPGEWTVDELAALAGMTVRNVRAYQSRGLLDPPAVRGRTGYYGRGHLARLERVRALQAQGFNLEAIRRLIEAGGSESADGALGFLRAVQESFDAEAPQPVSLRELGAQWGEDGGRWLARAMQLGLVRDRGDGGYEYPSPRMARAARELVGLGIPLDRLMDLVERVRGHADGIADEYVAVFLEYALPPRTQGDDDRSRWHGAQEALERLSPMARDTLMALFAAAMHEATERTLADVLADRDGARPAGITGQV